jgi:hypothetical protein
METRQNIPERADNLHNWLSLLKLSGSLIPSIMLLSYSVIEHAEDDRGVHIAEMAFGISGVACSSLTIIMTDTRTLDFGTRPNAELLRDQQVERAKIAREVSGCLVWVGHTIHTVESEKFDRVLTYAHLASPGLSVTC